MNSISSSSINKKITIQHSEQTDNIFAEHAFCTVFAKICFNLKSCGKVENVYWDQRRMTQSSETCYKYKNVKILALVRLYCLSNGATLCLKVHKN